MISPVAYASVYFAFVVLFLTFSSNNKYVISGCTLIYIFRRRKKKEKDSSNISFECDVLLLYVSYVYYGFLFSIFFFLVGFLHFLDEEALHKTALEKC